MRHPLTPPPEKNSLSISIKEQNGKILDDGRVRLGSTIWGGGRKHRGKGTIPHAEGPWFNSCHCWSQTERERERERERDMQEKIIKTKKTEGLTDKWTV